MELKEKERRQGFDGKKRSIEPKGQLSTRKGTVCQGRVVFSAQARKISTLTLDTPMISRKDLTKCLRYIKITAQEKGVGGMGKTKGVRKSAAVKEKPCKMQGTIMPKVCEKYDDMSVPISEVVNMLVTDYLRNVKVGGGT